MGKKAKIYTVLYDEDLDELISIVNRFLREGWKCQGSVTQGANNYMQSMVK